MRNLSSRHHKFFVYASFALIIWHLLHLILIEKGNSANRDDLIFLDTIIVHPEDENDTHSNDDIPSERISPPLRCNGGKYCMRHQSEDNLSKFVLHVGPSKTGTTAIQSQIQNRHVLALLALDNYTIVEHDMIHDRNFIKFSGGSYEFQQPFVQFIEKQKQERPAKNIIGSSEYLAGRGPANERECTAWMKLLEKPRDNGTKMWDLRVLLTYRRLHDVLPSQWNQRWKHQRGKDNTPIGPHKFWPGVNGDTRIKTFEEWFIDDILRGRKNGTVYHYAFSAYNTWKACSDHITLLNYHHIERGPDLVTNFFCNQVLNTNHTCSFFLSGSEYIEKEVEITKNPSVTLDYDILAVHAHDIGLIQERWQRQKVVRKVKEFIEGKNNTALPLKCPNVTILNHIYEMSLEGEKWALRIMRDQNENQPSMPHGQESSILDANPLLDFHRDWNRSLEENKFCTLDAVEVLKDKQVSDFFRYNFS